MFKYIESVGDMSVENNSEEKFIANCFTLSKEDILKFDEQDNGPINNVIVGISNHCYGVRLFDDEHGLSADMFYINGKKNLRGDIIQLGLRDIDYYELLLRFCVMLSDLYSEVNALAAFNTFQQKLRGFLEKLGFITVTSLELERFKGKAAVMMGVSPRGLFKIDAIDQKQFYREFFNNIVPQIIEPGQDYLYLMVNTETGLIKIGRSINPIYRERTLHSQEPSIHLIAIWRCGQEIEKQLHGKFNHKRQRGEWFSLTIPDLAEVERFMDGLRL